MPGVRFFQRAALISEALMCILALLAVRDLTRLVNSGFTRKLVGAAAFGLLVISLAPWQGRSVFQPAPAYAAVRDILDEVDRPIVATLPADRVGRAWFELSLLDVAAVNGISDLEGGQIVEWAASQGAGALAAHLESKGVTHLLVVDGPDDLLLSFGLEPPQFVSRMSFPVSGFEYASPTVTIYEVHALEGDEFCETCSGILRAYLEGENYPLEELSPGNTAWWMYGPNSELSLDTYGSSLEGDVRIRVGNTPCGDPRTVEIRNGPTVRVLTLTGQETAEVDLPVNNRTLERPIEIWVDGEECRGIDGDNRLFSLQVFQPEFITDK